MGLISRVSSRTYRTCKMSDRADRQKFRKQEYWDKRFLDESADDEHEWFAEYDQFSALVCAISPPASVRKVLVLGCGNSSLSIDISRDYEDANVTSHDYSAVVIDAMRERYADFKNLQWDVCDCRKIPDSPNYDLIIEKGVLDALVAGSRSPCRTP